MHTKVIGFGHYKQSGKSSICDAIVKYAYSIQIERQNSLTLRYEWKTPKVKIYSFADKLKQFCIEVLGLEYKQCYGTDEDKESLTNIKWEEVPGISTKLVLSETEIAYYNKEFNVQFHAPGYMTAREVLQHFGTGICRKMYPNCWVDATMRQIKKDAPDIALVPDMRFPNEAEAIQRIGGTTVKLLRRPFPDDNHPSEISLDGYEFDFVFDNRNWTIDEKNVHIIEEFKRVGLLT